LRIAHCRWSTAGHKIDTLVACPQQIRLLDQNSAVSNTIDVFHMFDVHIHSTITQHVLHMFYNVQGTCCLWVPMGVYIFAHKHK